MGGVGKFGGPYDDDDYQPNTIRGLMALGIAFILGAFCGWGLALVFVS
jgi:hypothetical protein